MIVDVDGMVLPQQIDYRSTLAVVDACQHQRIPHDLWAGGTLLWSSGTIHSPYIGQTAPRVSDDPQLGVANTSSTKCT